MFAPERLFAYLKEGLGLIALALVQPFHVMATVDYSPAIFAVLLVLTNEYLLTMMLHFFAELVKAVRLLSNI